MRGRAGARRAVAWFHRDRDAVRLGRDNGRNCAAAADVRNENPFSSEKRNQDDLGLPVSNDANAFP